MIAQRKSIIKEHSKAVGKEAASRRIKNNADNGQADLPEDLDDDQVYQIIQQEENQV